MPGLGNRKSAAITLTLVMGLLAFHSACRGVSTEDSAFDLSGSTILLHQVPAGVCPGGVADEKTLHVKDSFFLAETELTNKLAAVVFQWGLDNGRISRSPGQHNTVDQTAVRWGGRVLVNLGSRHSQVMFLGDRFVVKPGLEDYPLIEVSWFGAVMLCNWMTEMVDGHDRNVVYRGMGPDWADDDTRENRRRNGFRLPSIDEWELAARYVDGVSWLPGDHASGDTDGACDDRYPSLDGRGLSAEYENFGWYRDNSGAPGSSGISPPRGTHPVGSSGSETGSTLSGKPNSLGLYDMSGNVWEWCFDDYHHMRVIKGGCWWTTRAFMRVGHWENFRPTYDGTLVGFRVARSGR